MSHYVMIRFTLCFLLLLSQVLVYAFNVPPGIANILHVTFNPPNVPAIRLTPRSILTAETPIVVRYTLIGAAAIYDPQAACQPKALSFFGVRDFIPQRFCTRDMSAVLQSLTLYRALRIEFPNEMSSWAVYLREVGIEPVGNTTDRNTLHGWAAFAGDRIARYFRNDGWNSLGDRGRSFRQQFRDFTNYKPLNCPTDDPRSLRRPLRWQPMINEQDRRGRFSAQVHVVPHIGNTVTPLVLTETQVTARRQPSPYVSPSKFRSISPKDLESVRRGLREVIQASLTLTPGRRFLANWWNNKLVSTAAISSFYETAANLSRFQIAQQFLGEMMAQHDALIVVWKEKRRHDLARPRTVLLNVRRGQRFMAYARQVRQVRSVTAEQWLPFIDEQPHSEFPSGSAALCTAAMEHIETYTRSRFGSVPPIKIRVPLGAGAMLQFDLERDETVSFRGPTEAALNCGESRLWAGVHFRPAIVAGARVGKGVGKIVFDHIMMLDRGIRPSNCKRCL